MENINIEENLDLIDVVLISPSITLDSLNEFTSPYLLDYIKNGQHEKVKEIILKIDFDSFASKFASIDLKEIKYAGFGIATLACSAASLGGLPKTESRKMNSAFIQNEANFKSAKDVLVYVSRICFTLAKKVYDYKFNAIQSPTVFQAATYINEHIEERIFNKDVAQFTNCSVQYLTKVFREELNTTVSQYILNEKIKYSKQLIAADEIPVSKIYQRLNFCTHSHFTQTFKKIVGITPKQYKMKLQKDSKIK